MMVRTDGKGELAFCVEIQAFYCDAKVDIVDVAVDIDFDPDSNVMTAMLLN